MDAMASSKQLHHLATNPRAMARFQQTGRLPGAVVADSPLIRLLEAMGRGRLGQVRGLTIGPALGYTGVHRFDTAAQAMNWLKPLGETFRQPPSESWRDKRFAKKLFLEDVLEAATAYPQSLLTQCARLRRPAACKLAGEPQAGVAPPETKTLP